MRKNILILSVLFLLLLNPSIAQEKVAELETNYKSLSYNQKESLTISNPKTGELVILIEDKKHTNLYLLDSDMNLKESLKTEKLASNFISFIGYHITNVGKYGIIFSDNTNKKFGVLSFSFDTKKVFQTELNFKFNKEKYVEGITHNNLFYLMTVNKKDDYVNFYSLTDDYNFEKHAVSFKDITYTTPDGFKKKASNILLTGGGFSRISDLYKIDSNSPNSIETTSKKNKLYQVKDELVFTFDKEKKHTRLVRVKIPEFSVTTEIFDKKKLTIDGYESSFNHNSFFYKNTLYQISINNKEMYFSAKDTYSKKLLKDIVLKKEDSITFKNGPIVQEGGSSIFAEGRVRKLEKTSKFLRKVSSGFTGISAYTVGDLTQITLGSYIVTQSGGGMMMGGFGGVAGGSIGAISVAFNPTFGAYGGYSSSKSTYIDCLFDINFNHVPGDRKENVFDHIKKFEDNFKENNTSRAKESINIDDEIKVIYPKMKLKNVFYHNGNHYLSYLDTFDKKYHIVKF